MAQPNTYSPDDLVLSLGGIRVTGWNTITHTPDTDRFVKQTSTDGVTARAHSLNRGGMIEVEMQQTSEANALFTALFLADDLTRSGAVPCLLQEVGTLNVVFSAYAWLRADPVKEYGAEVGTRTWTIDLGQTDAFIGGNP